MTQDNQTAEEILQTIGASAKSAARELAQTSPDKINKALQAISKKLVASSAEIIKANNLDVEVGKQKNLTDALIDRLTLNEERIEAISSTRYLNVVVIFGGNHEVDTVILSAFV